MGCLCFNFCFFNKAINSFSRSFFKAKAQKRGRPPKYAGRVDRLTLNPTHFTPCLIENNMVAYEGKVYVKALNRLVKCVIVHTTKKDGSLRAEAFFCTDPTGVPATMDGAKVVECYRLRFQIEFLYRPAARRDAKQHTGLTECQARSESKIHTHVNASLTVVSLAKAVYAWPQTGQNRKPFSLSSIKTQYFNDICCVNFLPSSVYPPKPIKIRHSTKLYATTAVLPLESLQTIATLRQDANEKARA